MTQNRWLNWLLAWILNLAPLVITITWKTQKLIIDHLVVAIVNNVYEIYVTLKIIVVVLHNRDRYLYYRYTVWDPKISLMHRRILYFNDLSTIIINISLRVDVLFSENCLTLYDIGQLHLTKVQRMHADYNNWHHKL